MPAESYRCAVPIAVRYRDIDMLGHVNNAVYFTYFEMARFAYLERLTGVPATERDLNLVIVEATCRYRAPAFLGDALELNIRVSHLRRGSYAFEYVLLAGDDRLIAEGRTIQAAFNRQTGRATAIPAGFREQVERFEGRTFDLNAVIPPWSR